MKSLPLMLLLATGAAALAIEPRGNSVYTKCYKATNAQGFYLTFTSYVSDLRDVQYNNVIDSVVANGVWLYYNGYNYQSGLYVVGGIGGAFTFDQDYRNKCSSLRFAGSSNCMNCAMWELYDGSWYTGSEAYGSVSTSSLGSFSAKANSIIIIGKSYWTFYDGYSYSGNSVCLYADRHITVGNKKLDFGLFPYVTSLGLSNNAIRSVRSGCHSKNVVAPLELEALQITNDTLVFAVPPQE